MMSLPDDEMEPADHEADPSRAGRPCDAPRADQVTPESEDSHKLPVASDTTTWYWPVEDMASLRAFVIPDLANDHDVGAYEPWEKFTWVEVVDRPSAIAVDWSWMSEVVTRFVETVLASRDETPSWDVTPSVLTVAVEATREEPDIVENPTDPTLIVEPTMLEKPSCALTPREDTVAVEAVRVEPDIVEKPAEPTLSVDPTIVEKPSWELTPRVETVAVEAVTVEADTVEADKPLSAMELV
jgi:hypothetical protein